jgi:hypothetical protein
MTFCCFESDTNLCSTQKDREALSRLAYRKIITTRVRKQKFIYIYTYIFIYLSIYLFTYLFISFTSGLSGSQTVTHTEYYCGREMCSF